MSNTLKFGGGNWATKEGSALAYNDENGNFKPLPFDFTRASKATVINKDGLIETVGSGQPRIDYLDNTAGAMLLEPSRTNLITNSNNLTTWNGAAMTRTLVDDLVNPSNGLDASKLTQTSSGGYAWIARTFTGNETFSAFVKKDSSDFARLYAGGQSVYFNILNGTIETISGSVVDKSITDFGNGWFRISVTVNSTDASYLRIYPASSGSSSSGTNSLFVYGAQLEAGSYPTSYIKTEGSIVTRLADSCSQTVPDGVIGQTEGVLFIDSFIPNDGNEKVIQLSDGTNNNVVRIFARANGDLIRFQMVTGGGFVVLSSFSLLSNNTYKLAFKYKLNNVSMWANGVKLGIDTNCTIPSGLNRINFNDEGDTTKFYGNVKDVRIYNNALTDAELAVLTKI